MPEESAEWTGKWAAQRLKEHSEVRAVEVLAPQVLRITRTQLRPVVVSTIASARVEASTVNALLGTRQDIEFIANIPRESLWTGDAIQAAIRHRAAWGSFRDLFSATADENPNKWENREFAFFERVLRQHDRVTNVEREFDRKYVVRREALPSVSVVLLNEYDLTADHVRTARDRYGRFDIVFHSNPNGGITSDATDAAESLGAHVYMLSDLLRQLNRP
ncbi:MAG: hypothetical protein WC211_00065 [Dehalococcoidia bacterium]